MRPTPQQELAACFTASLPFGACGDALVASSQVLSSFTPLGRALGSLQRPIHQCR